MFQKIKLLLSSIRFWIIVLGAALAVLKEIAGDGLTSAELITIGQAAITAVVALGTFDSIATKIGGTPAKKK